MMNPILKRTICGLGVGALVIGLFLYCPLRALMPIVLVLSAFAQLEFYAMAKRKYEPVTWFGLLMGAAWIAWVGYAGFGKALLLVFCSFAPALLVALSLLCLLVLFNSRYRNPVGSIAVTAFGFLYVPFMLAFFLLIAQLTGDGWWGRDGAGIDKWLSRAGLYTLFALIAVSKFSDTGGFAFGMAFGKHKMCPAISPKKSWEGLAGSMIFSAVTAAVMLALARHFGWGDEIRFWNALTYPVAMAGGALLALVATACDLIESRFKREFDVKDSSVFLPAGMGGLLDMFDSVLFIPALAYPFILYFNEVGLR
jgi:phosphatidate cytidylyltransferase